ncbi:MAG: hypothetical protein OSJ60_10360 [Lachnospiraceae bacterium]|nr:hypothetical protein [Lachnospiraceae bacterium]
MKKFWGYLCIIGCCAGIYIIFICENPIQVFTTIFFISIPGTLACICFATSKRTNNNTNSQRKKIDTNRNKAVSQDQSSAPDSNLQLDENDTQDLLAWQNVLYPDTPQLKFSASQLKNLSARMIPRQSQIAHDCMELVNTTAVPETFFSRYDLLLEKLTLLSNLEKYVRFNTYSPTQQLDSAIRKKPLATKAFIDRYWAATINKASSLKTEKGKRNRYQKFYDTLLSYSDKMTEDNILHIKNIIKDKIDIEKPSNNIDVQTQALQNILVNILTKSVHRKMGGGVTFETSNDEDKFFRELIKNTLEVNLNPDYFYFEPMSNRSFSIYYQNFPIGSIKLYGRKTYMQILDGLYGINVLHDLPLNEYILHIPQWIKHIEHCLTVKEQCLTP